MTSAEQLLVAMRRFLKLQVQEDLQGAKAYQNRICVNLLGILERQARLGGDLDALDRQCLDLLQLTAGDAPVALARALRDTDVAAEGELMSYLRRRALLSLAIDNPRYSGYAQARTLWVSDTHWLDALPGANENT